MCGRYTLTHHQDVVAAFEVQRDLTAGSEWWKPRYNVAPTQPAPVVVLRDGVRALEMMRWGLVPHWGTQPGAKPPLMINARVESVGGKQVYRDSLAHRRCLVPADGFLEWARSRHKAAKPRPYWFHPADGGLIAFAGLWTRASVMERASEGSRRGADLWSFTILTGAANALVSPIHDRMPIVLAPAAYAAWLDPSIGADAARALLAVPPAEPWRVEPVSTRINAAANDDPACLAPPDPELF